MKKIVLFLLITLTLFGNNIDPTKEAIALSVVDTLEKASKFSKDFYPLDVAIYETPNTKKPYYLVFLVNLDDAAAVLERVKKAYPKAKKVSAKKVKAKITNLYPRHEQLVLEQRKKQLSLAKSQQKYQVTTKVHQQQYIKNRFKPYKKTTPYGHFLAFGISYNNYKSESLDYGYGSFAIIMGFEKPKYRYDMSFSFGDLLEARFNVDYLRRIGKWPNSFFFVGINVGYLKTMEKTNLLNTASYGLDAGFRWNSFELGATYFASSDIDSLSEFFLRYRF